jgi:hypothetical protein
LQVHKKQKTKVLDGIVQFIRSTYPEARDLHQIYT